MAAELNGCAAQWSRSTAQGGPTLIFQSKTSRWPFRVTWSEQIAHQVDSSTWILFQARSRVTSLFTNLHTVDELTNELESLTSSSVCQLSGKTLTWNWQRCRQMKMLLSRVERWSPNRETRVTQFARPRLAAKCEILFSHVLHSFEEHCGGTVAANVSHFIRDLIRSTYDDVWLIKFHFNQNFKSDLHLICISGSFKCADSVGEGFVWKFHQLTTIFGWWNSI